MMRPDAGQPDRTQSIVCALTTPPDLRIHDTMSCCASALLRRRPVQSMHRAAVSLIMSANCNFASLFLVKPRSQCWKIAHVD